MAQGSCCFFDPFFLHIQPFFALISAHITPYLSNVQPCQTNDPRPPRTAYYAPTPVLSNDPFHLVPAPIPGWTATLMVVRQGGTSTYEKYHLSANKKSLFCWFEDEMSQCRILRREWHRGGGRPGACWCSHWELNSYQARSQRCVRKFDPKFVTLDCLFQGFQGFIVSDNHCLWA